MEERAQSALPAVAVPVHPRRCPACEGDIPPDSPEGLCPRCLIGSGLRASEPSPPLLDVRGTTPYGEPAPAPAASALANHFAQLEILELLGQGGMGAVYKARQTKLDRIVAVKILPAEWGKDPAFAERFSREAKALARLSHPSIVAVHDFGESDGLFYLVMEYVDGANLRNILANGGLEPHEALAIIPQICDALQYAHEEGIVHRDIKPENILLDSKGRVKIADFGLAKLVNRPRAMFTLTGSQQVMGTLDYMAPEQRLRPQEVDHRADIYSLGVVFYEMLTGELPLGRFAPPSSKVGVDARLDGIVFRALEREPGQRYQRISEVKTAVEALSRQTPSPAPPAPALFREPVDPEPEAVRNKLWLMKWALLGISLLWWAVVPLWLLVVYLAGGTDDNYSRALRSSTFMLPLSVIVGFGAHRLSRRENLSFVRLTVVLALLPLSPSSLITIPVGLWILVGLGDPRVRAAFDRRGQGKPSAAEGRGKPGRESIARGNLLCLPIKLGKVGEFQYPGLLRLEDDALVLEYQTGTIRKKLKENTIPLKHIRLIRLKRGWFFTTMTLQTGSLKALEGIPTGDQGMLRLSLAKRDREIAERFIATIQRFASVIEVEQFPAPVPQDASHDFHAPDRAATPPQPTWLVHRKVRSLFNSVYTMFFSRAKEPETTTNPPPTP